MPVNTTKRQKEKIRTYRGNVRLRDQGVEFGLTKIQREEFIKCALDPIYFIENYVKVLDLDRGMVLMKLHDYQIEMVNALMDNREVIFCTARQVGKTTVIGAFITWTILFQKSQIVGILAHKEAGAKEVLHRIRSSYEELPFWLQQGVVEWNKKSIELENGARVMTSGTTGDGLRSKSINILYIDEAAFIPSNIFDDFFTSTYPTLSSGTETRLFMSSTPKGLNSFYKFWTEAEQNINGMVPVAVPWWRVPGRDEAWKQKQIKVMGEDKFLQEHEISFLGSSGSLIPIRKIKELAVKKPKMTAENDRLKIYELPEKDHQYFISVDVSEGKELDYSAFHVIDITEMPYRVVATYHDNDISHLLYPSVILNVALGYNKADVLVETNGAGDTVATILYYDFEYENVVVPSFSKREIGLKQNKKTKAIGCGAFKDLIVGNKLIVNDQKTINEMTTFVAKGKSYQADDGSHDDLVMSLVNFSYFTTTQLFSDLMDINIRKEIHERRDAEIEEDMLGFFGISDGINDDDLVPEGYERTTLNHYI